MEENDDTDITTYLDVLPYYDREYEETIIKMKVKDLIEQEKKKINKNVEDYLELLEPLEMKQWDPETHPFLCELFRAVKEKKCLYDKERYNKIPEYNSNESYEYNMRNLQIVNILREYYHIKNTNLNLLKANRGVLLSLNKGNKAENTYLGEHLETVKEATNEINKKRKFDQMKAGKTLDRFKVDLQRAIDDIASISDECERLKKRMKLTHDDNDE